MSTEPEAKTTTDAAKNPRAAPRVTNGFEPIKVKELRFCQPNGRDLPLDGSNGGMAKVIAGPRSWGDEITIQFEPWQRHHRVRCVTGDGKIKSEFCIPEAWCMYIPDLPA